MQHVENDLDNTIEKLSQTNLKFDEKDKLYQLAEGETQALNRKLVLLEDELQRSESKLATTTADLSEASTRADDINKAIKVLETKNMIDEERKMAYYLFSTHPMQDFFISYSMLIATICCRCGHVGEPSERGPPNGGRE